MPRRNGVLDNRRSSHPMLEIELTELRLTNEYFDGDPGYESFLTVQAQDVVIRDLIPSYGPWAARPIRRAHRVLTGRRVREAHISDITQVRVPALPHFVAPRGAGRRLSDGARADGADPSPPARRRLGAAPRHRRRT